MHPLFAILVFVVPTVSAQYDTFTFNVTLMCSANGQFNYDATFNVRDVDPSKPISLGEIGHHNGVGNHGLNRFEVTGFYEFETSKSPVWEPIGVLNHGCVSKGKKGFRSLKMNFASVPALRDRTLYIYQFYMDITDKEGNIRPDALIKTIKNRLG